MAGDLCFQQILNRIEAGEFLNRFLKISYRSSAYHFNGVI